MNSGSRAMLALALATVALAVEAQPAERLLVGVMRRDGVILPFASYDGDWSVPWPVSIRNIDLPVTLDAVPKKWWGREMPAFWNFWPIGASEPVRVTPIAPAVVMVGRERRLGLRSGIVSNEPLPTPFVLPYPKEGVAVAGDVKVDAIPVVSRRSTAWPDLPKMLQEDILLAEQKAIDRLRANAQWAHPIPRERRQSVPAELEAWYASTLEQPGFTASYIEAVKKYPPQPEDDGCGLETFVTGWVHTNNRQPRPKTDLTARITYCDREGVSYVLPLGQMRVKKRTHWVVQVSSWESEWYSVIEATPGRVRYVAEYYGGGRPRSF